MRRKDTTKVQFSQVITQNEFYKSLRILLDCFIEGVLIIDSKYNTIVNNRFEEIFNIKHGQPSNIYEILKKYGLNELLESDGDVEKDVYLNNKKTKVRTFKIDLSEKFEFILIIFKEMKSLENSKFLINELKKQVNLMRTVLDNAYQGIVLVDEDSKIIKWNYEKLFGIKEVDVLNKPVEEVIENTRLNIVVKTGQKELFNIQRIQGHDMITSRTPIIKNGKVIGAVGTVLFKDIKEVKDLVMKIKKLEEKVDNYKTEISKMYCSNYTFENIITQNEKMLKLKDIAKNIAKSDSTVLIQGESGTGKEYFAHAIHATSKRKHAPFIKINCASIPHELLESELFGYEAGAFTGAKNKGKIGKLELANGGTILLDEISSMPYNMQSKLLRVLEEKRISKIGSNAETKIDIRIISCTNEDLKTLVNKGKFRQDLFYRLNVVRIDIIPLRERLDDISILSEYIIKQLVHTVGLPFKTVTDKADSALKLYNWPGNVRELRNILERALNMSTNNYVDLDNLPDYISNRMQIDGKNKEKNLLKDKVGKAEINAILKALSNANGNRTEAAKLLGIHRTSLYKKIESYGIDIKAI